MVRLGQGPGGAAQLLDHVAGPERLVRDRLDDVQGLGRVAGVPAQERGGAVGIGRDGGQRLVEFVGKAGGQVAQDVLVRAGRPAARRPAPALASLRLCS